MNTATIMVTYISLVNAIPTWMYLYLQIFSTEPNVYLHKETDIILWHCTCTTKHLVVCRFSTYLLYVLIQYAYKICPTKARQGVLESQPMYMKSTEKYHSKIHIRDASHVCVCIKLFNEYPVKFYYRFSIVPLYIQDKDLQVIISNKSNLRVRYTDWNNTTRK